MNNYISASAIKQAALFLSLHVLLRLFRFLEKLQVSGTHLSFFILHFVECGPLVRAVALVCIPVHPQTKDLSTHRAQTGTAWHIPSHYAACFLSLSFFFSFLEGCRAALQFRNIRQEQMTRTCLFVGGKCQPPHIHQQRHCLFSLEVIASPPSPLILSHCGESSK